MSLPGDVVRTLCCFLPSSYPVPDKFIPIPWPLVQCAWHPSRIPGEKEYNWLSEILPFGSVFPSSHPYYVVKMKMTAFVDGGFPQAFLKLRLRGRKENGTWFKIPWLVSGKITRSLIWHLTREVLALTAMRINLDGRKMILKILISVIFIFPSCVGLRGLVINLKCLELLGCKEH